MHPFLYISQPLSHDYDLKVPNFNFTFRRGREHKTTTFLFLSWILIDSFRIQLQKNLPTFDQLTAIEQASLFKRRFRSRRRCLVEMAGPATSKMPWEFWYYFYIHWLILWNLSYHRLACIQSQKTAEWVADVIHHVGKKTTRTSAKLRVQQKGRFKRAAFR